MRVLLLFGLPPLVAPLALFEPMGKSGLSAQFVALFARFPSRS